MFNTDVKSTKAPVPVPIQLHLTQQRPICSTACVIQLRWEYQHSKHYQWIYLAPFALQKTAVYIATHNDSSQFSITQSINQRNQSINQINNQSTNQSVVLPRTGPGPGLLLLPLLLSLSVLVLSSSSFLLVAPQVVLGQVSVILLLLLLPGLAIKNPSKKPKKTHLKKPLKMFFFRVFLGFLKFLIFYENNTNFSLWNRFFTNK